MAVQIRKEGEEAKPKRVKTQLLCILTSRYPVNFNCCTEVQNTAAKKL